MPTYTLPSGLSSRQKKALAALLACKPCCGGSGSGSGSGGGGNLYCCGCTRFACSDVDNFPDNLDLTLVVPCLGTKTVTLPKLVDNFGTEIFNRCTGGNLIEGVNAYYEIEENNLTDPGEAILYNFTNCLNGLPASAFLQVAGEFFQANIRCMNCSASCDTLTNQESYSHLWVLEFQWRKYDSGTSSVLQVHGYVLMDIASCEPFSLTGSTTITCHAYGSDPPEIVICEEDSNVKTHMTDCDGDTVQADADES